MQDFDVIKEANAIVEKVAQKERSELAYLNMLIALSIGSLYVCDVKDEDARKNIIQKMINATVSVFEKSNFRVTNKVAFGMMFELMLSKILSDDVDTLQKSLKALFDCAIWNECLFDAQKEVTNQ